ncbi:DUF3574 domain-containing protein [Streptomyces sp. NPDC015171]|uniref:DUF3574 domain-containing protein n=1 Tax=Streptomyces sp. NPDC015171 TaxID=3364945 RepID=UPI0037003561
MSFELAARTRMVTVTLAAALLGASGSAAYAAFGGHGPAPSGAPASVAPVGKPYIKTELLFGTARPDGGAPVTDAEFRGFLDTLVTPRFPAGLTVDDVHGQYRDAHGTIERERSYRLTLLYPRGEAAGAGRRIEEIRAAYGKRFQQESVARVDDDERVDF